MRHILLLWLALTVGVAEATAQQRDSALPRLGFDEQLTGQAQLAAALEASGLTGADLSVFVRLEVFAPAAGAPDAGTLEALDGRLRTYAALDVPVLIALRGTPADENAADSWQQTVRVLAERSDGVLGWQIGAGGQEDATPDALRRYAFFLKLASVQIRSVRPSAQVLPAAPPASADPVEWLAGLYAEDVREYVDAAVLGGRLVTDADLERFRNATAVARAGDDDESILLAGLPLGDAPQGWLVPLATVAFDGPGSLTFSGSAQDVSAVIAEASRAREILAPDVVELDEESVGLTLTLDGEDVTASLPHRLLYNLSTLSTYLVHWNAPAGSRLEFELTDPLGLRPVVLDVSAGTTGDAEAFVRDDDTGRSRVTVPGSPQAGVVAFRPIDEIVVERVAVNAAASLSVEEIIVRHQQAQASQDALYEHYVARAVMEQHFRLTATLTADIVSEARYYWDRQGVEWEELTFTLNGGTWGADRPAFPMLQPEKVLSLPLDLRLNRDYRYVLHGTDRLDDRLAYVVGFEPLSSERSLYRGRVWIDTETFVKLKVQAVQTGLAPPAVSNEVTQHFAPVATVDGQPLFLFERLVGKELYLIAGRNTLVEKAVTFSDFRVNSPDFVELRTVARRSDRIMYRDTDQGLRYFVKDGETRVVSDRGTLSSTALAMGVTIDPSFDYPLPIVGINHLDFEFLDQDTQLALLFGGILVLANVQRPTLGPTPFDASIDLFAIAVPTNDQVFDSTSERRDERVLAVPFSTGVNLGYQFTDFQRVTLGYQFQYDLYRRDEETADDFVIPSSTATNGTSLAYEYSRGGYVVGAAAAVFRRASWAPWGRGDSDYDPAHNTFLRYEITASKDLLFGPFQRVHVDGAWYGGRDLDRFSMYRFGLFDETRMHGVPAAGVRFPELAMFRASYSFNVLEQYRFDAFFDQAVGQDPSDRSRWLPVTGTGVAVSTRAPFQTILRFDVGKSFLPDAYAGAGSLVVELQILKPL